MVEEHGDLETNDTDYSDWLFEVQLELAATRTRLVLASCLGSEGTGSIPSWLTKTVEISTHVRCNGRVGDDGTRLIGKRLVLREFVDTDENAVHAYASDSMVTQFMDWGPNSIEDTRTFLGQATGQIGAPSRRRFDLAIVDITSQALIGSAA